MAKHNIKDLTDQVFGRLVARRCVGKDVDDRLLWLCDCECGGKKVVSSTCLLNGATRSCGCINKEKSELNSQDNSDELGISATSYQEVKTRLGFKGKVNSNQLAEIKKEVDEISRRFDKVTLWSINRYFTYVRDAE